MKLFSAQRLGMKLLVTLLFLAGLSAIYGAPGDLDLGFNPAVYAPEFSNSINVIKKQPDGKYLVGGVFIKVNGFAAPGLLRLNADLTIDTSFNSYEFINLNYLSGTHAKVVGLGLQSDGKIIVVTNGSADTNIITQMRRLLPDGTLDTTFPATGLEYTKAYDVEVLPDDKFIVAGRRYHANGAFDNTFTGFSGCTIIPIPDNKYLAGCNGLNRYNTNGSVDVSHQGIVTSSMVKAIVYLPDGKSKIGGIGSVNGFPVGGIALINNDGTPDLTYNQNQPGFNGTVNDMILMPDGKLLVAGSFSSYNGVPRSRLALINPDGTLDDSFVPPDMSANTAANDIEILPDGRLLVGFDFGADILKVFNADGSAAAPLNLVFGHEGVRNVIQQPDGKILIFGYFKFVNGVARDRAARLNADGSLDASFVPDLPTATFPAVTAAALRPDGKMMVGGNGMLVRLNPDGSRDLSFSLTLPVQDTFNKIVVQPDGKVLAQGNLTYQFNRFPRILRWTETGTLDPGFNVPGANDGITTFALAPDGKIILGGAFITVNTQPRNHYARLNSDGTLDATFNPPGGANHIVWNAEVQPNGKIIFSGSFDGLNGSLNRKRVGRLNADGSLDTSFVQPLTIPVTGTGGDLKMRVQPDGKIILLGYFDTVGSVPRAGIVRFNTDGSLDTTFNPIVNKIPNNNSPITDVYTQTNGKILIAGSFTRVNGVSRSGIARLLGNLTRRAPYDFDGDGKTDIGVWRASSGSWWYLQSSDLSGHGFSFGLPDDIITPGDYTGDGKTDIAIWRPSTAEWFVQRSEDGSYFSYQSGLPGDIPAPADYDGDGITDTATFRPSTATWYIFQSGSGTYAILTFGLNGDKPVPADFDGDGKADIAVWRPSNGSWWIVHSSDLSQHGYGFGLGTDSPVVGDYTGDGKADIAVWRPSTSEWYFLRSEDGSYYSYPSGLPGDIPAPGDYDGDGKFDSAVFRPSTQTWYIDGSTAGSMIATFGLNGDRPVPNAFVP